MERTKIYGIKRDNGREIKDAPSKGASI